MHATVHIISREPLEYQQIAEIMEPYCEENVYSFNPETQEYTTPDPYPQFTWDYWDQRDPAMFENPKDCFILIDPDGYCIARKWWNGKTHVDQTKKFEDFCREHGDEWKGCYLQELDIHW